MVELARQGMSSVWSKAIDADVARTFGRPTSHRGEFGLGSRQVGRMGRGGDSGGGVRNRTRNGIQQVHATFFFSPVVCSCDIEMYPSRARNPRIIARTIEPSHAACEDVLSLDLAAQISLLYVNEHPFPRSPPAFPTRCTSRRTLADVTGGRKAWEVPL